MQKHWVEELFPPTYSYSIDKLLHASKISEPTSDAKTQSSSTNNLQDLYERVRVDYNQDTEQRRQKWTQVDSPIINYSKEKDLQNIDQSERLQSSTHDQKRPDQSELDDSCMWSKSELKILRNNHQKVKEEFANLTVLLKVAEEEKLSLEKKLHEQSEKLEIVQKSLHSSQQKCKRLAIKCGHLESEARLSSGRIKMLEEDALDLGQEKRTLKKLLREVHKALGQERRKTAEFDFQLQEDSHHLKMKQIASEEKLKLEFQMQTNRLLEELRESQEELEKERKEHSVNKKALNHLRIHFASLPVPGEVNVPGHIGHIKSW